MPAPSYLTLEEHERWAYASGDTHTAAILAEAVGKTAEAEALREELDNALDRIETLEMPK